MAAKKHKSKPSGIRIIAGRWRGRRIPVPEAGVRPTGDRIRETLFNWLQAGLPGTRCLDLYAGTGALGLEALSRGASQVVFIDSNRAATRLLAQTLTELGCGPGEAVVRPGNAMTMNLGALGPFDVVFLDPPFGAVDIGDLCKLLMESGALASVSKVYIEMRRGSALPALPPGWRCLRDQKAGKVRYGLLEFNISAMTDTAQGEGSCDQV